MSLAMPLVSSWPLNSGSLRYIIPPFALAVLATDVRSRDCYPDALGYYEAAADHAMQRSQSEHEDHLLLYCTQGEATLEVDDVELVISAGMLVILPAGTAHRYSASTQRPWSLYWVHVCGSAVNEFMAPLLNERINQRLNETLNEQTYAVLTLGTPPALLADWRGLIEMRSPGFEPAALQLAAARLRQLLVHIAWLARSGSGPRSRLDTAVIQQFMQAHLTEAVTLTQLADVAGMEKFHFAKTFKRLVGQSPLQHFLHLRMTRACEWLDAGEEGISEIAQRLGYSDAPYFSRQFRQIIGMAPSAYRALKRG
jgi:AraC-like DNA-binding protein